MNMRNISLPSIFVVLAFLAAGTASAQEGMAVYYSDKFQGRPTASGEIFDQQALTAAHKKLPFGTQVKVTNLDNNQSVVLKINDRMASNNRNVIDVSRHAARELGFERKGRTRVRIEVLQ
jgi:rare lipoprotein A